ncbi:hypothetical protein EJB05_28111 [Eragrostis curvula]|uniref:Uncharacterized protein n=1 Tax=Eragrostis curvula TaxID=38414 RepID=A0A5J9UQI2_9POAL|nr:hypothetical protein EJB05_28111 [Eragrostis curvula]
MPNLRGASQRPSRTQRPSPIKADLLAIVGKRGRDSAACPHPPSTSSTNSSRRRPAGRVPKSR